MPQGSAVTGGAWRLAAGSGDASQDLASPSVIRTMTVVTAAHNEHRYMGRTIQPIYDATPASVLNDIIVVDVASS